jgi:hypothetical protein
VIRRLLGVRVGAVRTVLFALVAFLLAGPMLNAVLPSVEQADPLTVTLYFAAAICIASLLAMVGLVIAEVIVPEGSLPGPIELWRSWRTRVTRARRYGRSCASQPGTASVGSCAGGATRDSSPRCSDATWRGRCSVPWTKAV